MGSGNVARNSTAGASSRDNRSLELQCFRVCSNNDRRKLCANLSGAGAVACGSCGMAEQALADRVRRAGAEAASGADVVPKLQTTSAKNAENGPLWAR